MDVLILYENKNREIENAALLATELEKRKYSVKIDNIYSPFKYFVKPKVLVVPHLYNEQQLISFAKNFWLKNDCIVDLQYEQILSNNVDIENDIHSPKGQARFAHHIAWGDDQAQRYLQCGIKKENIHITGSMSMDLMREQFSSCFYSKIQIAKEFGIDEKKDWVLFISSFSYANRTEEDLLRFEQMNPKARAFNKISDVSLEAVTEWLKHAATEYPDKIFIYRPHPAEKVCNKIFKMQKELNNFYCIDKYSMRQWAKVVDSVYNWYSTSIADVYFAKKRCYILRPVELPKAMEVSILDEATHITTCQEFLKTLKNDNQNMFPVSNKMMERFYGSIDNEMSYKKTANLCEQLILGQLKGYQYDFGKNRFDMCNLRNPLKILINWFNIPFYFLCVKFRIQSIGFFKKKKHLLKIFSQDVYGADTEISSYKKRFRTLIK